MGINPVWIERFEVDGRGPTVAVKDCLDIAGLRTSCGSKAFANAPPATINAVVVNALIDAGCSILGKTNMHELAYGVTGINGWAGTPINPLFPDRVPGGSSSGSAAAVAAGLVNFSIGTDTGGSIRVPATCCGVTGLKPTFGVVSRQGAHPAESSLDCIGPFAPDVATIEQAMAIIAPGFVARARPEGVVLGVVTVEADADVLRAVSDAVRRSGQRTIAVELPSFVAAFKAGITLMGAEMAPLFGHLCGTGLLGADVDARLAAAGMLTANDVGAAEAVRATFQREVDAALETVDMLALPAMPSVPLLVEDAGDAPATLRMTNLVRPFNVSGHPVLSLPLLTRDGLPAGIQLVGRQGGDAALCAAAALFEESIR